MSFISSSFSIFIISNFLFHLKRFDDHTSSSVPQNSKPHQYQKSTELNQSEILTLSCGVLFFVAFFVAMYVEVKATDTLYRLCTSFFYINQTMHIYEYDRKKDMLYSGTNEPV